MPDINSLERFARVPNIERPRSMFNKSSGHTTTFNVGEVVPIYVDFLYPGTTVQMKTNKVVRLQTIVTPFYGNLYCDIHWYFVPMRLVWSHAREFFGENNSSAWIPQTTYQVPSISAPSGGFAPGGIADHMGLPVGITWNNSGERRPMALPFRAYALICNDLWRSENLTDPLNIPIGDSNQTGTNGGSYINDVANGGKCFVACKFFDRFTGALPSPQKGPSVSFPLVQGAMAPVGTRGQDIINSTSFGGPALQWRAVDGTSPSASDHFNVAISSGSSTPYKWFTHTRTGASESGTHSLTPSNLWADLSGTVGAVTVNELRLAFQLQRYYEAIARSGSRYIELMRGLFGVESDDARLQRPEYLGGNRVPLSVHEVVNQAQTSQDFLGDLGAFSHTSDQHEDFIYSTREHGFLIATCCCRYDHVYSQGIERFWSRLDREDYYIPQFANIGEMPVFQDELCATSTNMATKKVFGYQEAWSDLRYKQSVVTNLMRPSVTASLASWNLSDNYTTAPTLSDSWVREDPSMVDRVLTVAHTTSDQIFADFWFDTKYTEVLPAYSVPGLIDHY